MAYEFQVVQDSSDPHTQADWWAETLGWAVEPSNEDFIREMVAKGFATDADTKIHNGTLVWREGQAIHDEGQPRVLFQLVPEGKTVKNRMHLDLRIGTDDVETVVEKLTARGAKFLHRGQQGPHTWVTMADPEGNEFCVSQSPPAHKE
jgi:predicted enzyme related to lactoylglutathione lyase